MQKSIFMLRLKTFPWIALKIQHCEIQFRYLPLTWWVQTFFYKMPHFAIITALWIITKVLLCKHSSVTIWVSLDLFTNYIRKARHKQKATIQTDNFWALSLRRICILLPSRVEVSKPYALYNTTVKMQGKYELGNTNNSLLHDFLLKIKRRL